MKLLRGDKKKAADTGPTTGRHVELWGHIVENNRFLRRVTGAAITWSFLALALGAYGLLTGLFRPLAFHVDPDGQATFVGRMREQMAPSDPEVRYVAKEFLKRYLAFNSLTIASDLAEAWNLMTEDLRTQQNEMFRRYSDEHREEFVAYVKRQAVQTVLEFDSKRVEVTDHNGKTFSVHLRGTMRTWPLNRVGEEAAFQARDFESFVTLVRCPRTEKTPNGLLVSKVSTRFFVDEKKSVAPLDPHIKPATQPTKE